MISCGPGSLEWHTLTWIWVFNTFHASITRTNCTFEFENPVSVLFQLGLCAVKWANMNCFIRNGFLIVLLTGLLLTSKLNPSPRLISISSLFSSLNSSGKHSHCFTDTPRASPLSCHSVCQYRSRCTFTDKPCVTCVTNPCWPFLYKIKYRTV